MPTVASRDNSYSFCAKFPKPLIVDCGGEQSHRSANAQNYMDYYCGQMLLKNSVSQPNLIMGDQPLIRHRVETQRQKKAKGRMMLFPENIQKPKNSKEQHSVRCKKADSARKIKTARSMTSELDDVKLTWLSLFAMNDQISTQSTQDIGNDTMPSQHQNSEETKTAARIEETGPENIIAAQKKPEKELKSEPASKSVDQQASPTPRIEAIDPKNIMALQKDLKSEPAPKSVDQQTNTTPRIEAVWKGLKSENSPQSVDQQTNTTPRIEVVQKELKSEKRPESGDQQTNTTPRMKVIGPENIMAVHKELKSENRSESVGQQTKTTIRSAETGPGNMNTNVETPANEAHLQKPFLKSARNLLAQYIPIVYTIVLTAIILLLRGTVSVRKKVPKLMHTMIQLIWHFKRPEYTLRQCILNSIIIFLKLYFRIRFRK